MNIGLDMVDKTVLITGTSRGIGFKLAERFLREGFKVIGISRTKTSIIHDGFTDISADLSNPIEVQQVVGHLGNTAVSGLINNAGIHGPVGEFEHTTIDEWISTFQVNLFAAASISQMCIPSLRSEKGFIIFMSGGGSAFPRKNYSAYGVSKCGVIRLADTMALELNGDVMVYCIAPGPNRTGLLDETRASGELVSEEDVVDFSYPENLCVFLARNRDQRYSGKFIHVKDNYSSWDESQLDSIAYTMRRLDLRTIRQITL